MNLSKPTWGLKPAIIKTIYLTVIEKIILYARGIWFNDKEKLKLPQLQRSALLTITKCYRTVSTETLCALSGCLPVYLLLKSEIEYLQYVDQVCWNNIFF